MRNTALIDKVLAAAVAGGRIAGLTAAAADEQGSIYTAAFGLRAIDEPKRMTTDTVFRIASMTKAVTGVAAMQMVEQGKLSLDQPAREILPFLAETQVLDGFDSAGKPILRAPKGEITLRNLLTHTAGFVYDTWNADMNRYAQLTGLPAARSGLLDALKAPLGFDPGTRWEYGINIDIAGRMVEVASGMDLEAYLQAHVFGPLGMTDTSFIQRPEWDSRLATVHTRQPDGSLRRLDLQAPAKPREFYPGGGGLYSTSPDYLKFLQALMGGGEFGGKTILRPETVTLMGQNHMGDLDVLPMKSAVAHLSNDVELFPGMAKKWGLTFLINTEKGPHGRNPGSLAWAGLNNTYYWLDPVRKVAGVIMTQVLPFADPTVLEALNQFEAAVYETVG